MTKVAIITDSTAAIPPELAAALNITVVPPLPSTGMGKPIVMASTFLIRIFIHVCANRKPFPPLPKPALEILHGFMMIFLVKATMSSPS